MSSPLSTSAAVTAVLDNLIQGDVAQGVADSGNPLKLGGVASSTVPAGVTSGQRVSAYFDTQGYQNIKSLVQGDTASGATDAGNPVKIGGLASASLPAAVANGQRVNAYFDPNGRQHVVTEVTQPLAVDDTNAVIGQAVTPLAVAKYSWTRFQNLGANATLNVKATSGNVFSLYASNVSGAPRWIQLHNTATTPAGAAVPIYSFLVPSGGNTLIDAAFFGANGMNFTLGIAFADSTTEATYTAATATDMNVYIQYK